MTSVINPTLECECGCNKAQHTNGRGFCIGVNSAGNNCQCSRFVKLTAQTKRMRLMENALHCAIDMLEDMPEEGEEHTQMVCQMKAAIKGNIFSLPLETPTDSEATRKDATTELYKEIFEV